MCVCEGVRAGPRLVKRLLLSVCDAEALKEEKILHGASVQEHSAAVPAGLSSQSYNNKVTADCNGKP